MGLFRDWNSPRPTAADLAAQRPERERRAWGGVRVGVAALPPWRLIRRPTPLVLLGDAPLVVPLDELRRMVQRGAGTAENPAGFATVFVSDRRAVAPDSPVGAVVRDVPTDRVVVVSDHDGAVRLDAVLTWSELEELVAWASAALAASEPAVPEADHR